MTTHLLHQMAMIAQEPGSNPGTGLKAWQTFTLYLVAPVGLFGVITASVLVFTRKKKSN
jgi:hypothetical protein